VRTMMFGYAVSLVTLDPLLVLSHAQDEVPPHRHAIDEQHLHILRAPDPRRPRQRLLQNLYLSLSLSLSLPPPPRPSLSPSLFPLRSA